MTGVQTCALPIYGRELEAATTATDHPTPGTTVAVEIDPSGIVEVPLED